MFYFGSNLLKKGSKLHPWVLLFRWKVLRGMVWHLFGDFSQSEKLGLGLSNLWYLYNMKKRMFLQKVFYLIMYYGLCWHKMRNFASPFHFLGYCFTARVSLTLCARGASDCGQSFLMNEPGSSLHNGMKTFWKYDFYITKISQDLKRI